LDQKLIKK